METNQRLAIKLLRIFAIRMCVFATSLSKKIAFNVVLDICFEQNTNHIKSKNIYITRARFGIKTNTTLIFAVAKGCTNQKYFYHLHNLDIKFSKSALSTSKSNKELQ